MTRDEILKLEANSETDALIAVSVMGWRRMSWEKAYGQVGRTTLTPYWHSQDGKHAANVEDDDDYDCPQDGWHPSSDIVAAWEVVEKLKKRPVICLNVWHDDSGWCCSLNFIGGRYDAVRADTAPLAICRAALLAVMEK